MAGERVRKLQLWRNTVSNPIASLEDAKRAIGNLQGAADGEIVLARYYANGTNAQSNPPVVKSIMGIYYVNSGNGVSGWTYLEDVTASEGSAAAIQSELDETQAGAGLNNDGTYIPSNNEIISSSESLAEAIENVADAILNLDYDSMTQDDSEVVTLVSQENGVVEASTTSVIDLELTGFATDATAEGDVDGNDTIESAFNKVNNRIGGVEDTIGGLNKQTTGSNGLVVTSVTQSNGLVDEVKAYTKDLLLTAYEKDASAALPISAIDTIGNVLSKIENKFDEVDSGITATTVHSNDQTIVVTPDSRNGGTDIRVNLDGTTLVKDPTEGVISSTLKVIKVIPSGTAGTDEVVDSNLSTNVKEAYRLVYDGSTTAIGKQIDIYKDSALQLVYLGTANDTIDPTTGVITEDTSITDKQSLNFKYLLANGTYSLVKVDVSKFLTESEFGDGLQVSNAGVVSVKTGNGLEINSTSKAVDVKIDSTSENFLTVSSDGIKVSGIQSAINSSIANIDGDMPISVSTSNDVTTISFVVKQHVDGQDSNDMITLDSNYGFILSNTWDCGEYSVAPAEEPDVEPLEPDEPSKEP